MRKEKNLPRFFDKSFREKSFGDNLLTKIEYLTQFWEKNNTKVALFPAGELSKYILEKTKISRITKDIGDSNTNLQGKFIGEFKILTPIELISKKPDIILIASKNHEEEISKQFRKLDFKNILLPLSTIPAVPNPIDFWAWDDEFQLSISTTSDFSLLDEKRSFVLNQFAKQCINLPGDFVEVGVFQGGSSIQLGKILLNSNKHLHLFDTFEGMPPTDGNIDIFCEGDLKNTNLNEVRERLAFYKKTKFYPGFFPETASNLESKEFSFVHIDVDIYKSVLDCCEFFYEKITPSGIILFDDYGFVRCPGAKNAVDEFFANKPESPCYLPTGQCVVIKHPKNIK